MSNEKLSEKELEDIMWDAGVLPLGQVEVALRMRQPSVLFGWRPDLIGIGPDGRVYIIELKAGPVKNEHVAQLLRYKAVVEYILGDLVGKDINFYDPFMPQTLLADFCLAHSGSEGYARNFKPRYVLIGTSVSQETRWAADGAEIRVYTYKVQGDAIVISPSRRNAIGKENIGRCKQMFEALADEVEDRITLTFADPFGRGWAKMDEYDVEYVTRN
jgi:hypothetical protein